MKQIVFGAILAIGTMVSSGLSAATLGLATENPTVSASLSTVDYFDDGSGFIDMFVIGDVDGETGVSVGPNPFLSFGLGFDLLDPVSIFLGGFGIDSDNGQFLSGDLLAVGFTENVIELQFGNLAGSGAGSFGSSILATLTSRDFGTDPFGALAGGGFTTASVTVVSVVPLPAGIALLLSAIAGLAILRRRAIN